MYRFFTINTPYGQSPDGYANAEFTSAVSPTLARFGNQEEDDDFYDDEDEEREWCD